MLTISIRCTEEIFTKQNIEKLPKSESALPKVFSCKTPFTYTPLPTFVVEAVNNFFKVSANLDCRHMLHFLNLSNFIGTCFLKTATKF